MTVDAQRGVNQTNRGRTSREARRDLTKDTTGNKITGPGTLQQKSICSGTNGKSTQSDLGKN